MLRIAGETKALALDLACTNLILEWEGEQRKQQNYSLRYDFFRACAAVWGGLKLFDDSEIQQEEDSHVEIW